MVKCRHCVPRTCVGCLPLLWAHSLYCCQCPRVDLWHFPFSIIHTHWHSRRLVFQTKNSCCYTPWHEQTSNSASDIGKHNEYLFSRKLWYCHNWYESLYKHKLLTKTRFFTKTFTLANGMKCCKNYTKIIVSLCSSICERIINVFCQNNRQKHCFFFKGE